MFQEKHRSREEWLLEVTARVAPQILSRAGLTVPETTLVSCGLPSARALSTKSPRTGECWVEAGHIFVSPVIVNPYDVAQILVHELLHAALPVAVGHRAPFRRAADAMGLGGKPTQTVRTEGFDAWIGPIVVEAGVYPHRALVASRTTKQTTRLLKLMCPGCGYIVRTTAKWIKESLPYCGLCGDTFEEA